MIPETLSKLKKIKKRRILVISASGVKGGIQSLYLQTTNPWEILSYAFIPYIKKIDDILEKYSISNSCISPSEQSWLDYKMSMQFVESARVALSQQPTALRTPHLIVLNKPVVWKGATGENLQQFTWDISFGDAQYLASTFKTPVLTDLVRHNILAGGPGNLPLNPGNIRITSRCNGIVALINIGLISHISVIDTENSSLLVDSDTGPGTCLLNKLIKEYGNGIGFDRDGSLASQGNIDGTCLNHFAEHHWFLKPAPKTANYDQFDGFLDDPRLNSLNDADKISTVTSLTARTAYDFFKREYNLKSSPDTIYLSGGGANNLALMDYLQTYFDPLPVKSIEEIGIPTDTRIPLALGLTVDSYICGNSIFWETGNTPRIEPLGRLVLP